MALLIKPLLFLSFFLAEKDEDDFDNTGILMIEFPTVGSETISFEITSRSDVT